MDSKKIENIELTYLGLGDYQELKSAISYNINIIAGSMPEVHDDKLYNVGHLCKRDSSVDRYEKLHVTPNTEMILIADVDLDLLRQLNQFGAVRNLRDRRKNIFDLKKINNA